MKPFLHFLGVKDNDLTPFCATFTSPIALQNAFIQYCPKTLVYNKIQGTTILNDASDKNTDLPTSTITDEEIFKKKIKTFSKDLISEDTSLDDIDTENLTDINNSGNELDPTLSDEDTSKLMVSINFRVTRVYAKYYNTWYLSKENELNG